MTTIDATRSVAELTQSIPGAARAFERLGIDDCCRGKESLERACAAVDLPLARALSALDEAERERGPHTAPREPLALCRYLVDRHHQFTRRELARLEPLAEKVLRVHGAGHAELADVARLLRELTADLGPHMLKEERVLFPFIEALATGEPPSTPFATIDHPLRVMNMEHEHVGRLLAELERVTGRYTTPEGACGSYRALYAGLCELQADLHEHIHLENHVLFPAAQALELRPH